MNRLFPLLCLIAAACGAPTSDTAPDDTVCRRETIEPDLMVQGTLPALDGGSYVISSTYLKLRTTAAGQQAFQQVMGPIGEALAATPGLVGYITATSESCLTARTLSVYADETAMYAFVTGPAHGAAVQRVGEISRGGSIVTHWTGPGGEARWDEAARRIGVDPGPFY